MAPVIAKQALCCTFSNLLVIIWFVIQNIALRRIYIFLKEHHDVVQWIIFPGNLLFENIYFAF